MKFEISCIECHVFAIDSPFFNAKPVQQIARPAGLCDKCGKLFERATPKVKSRAIDVRVLCVREIFTRFLAIVKLLERLVARDGIEPLTAAFSGPLTDSPKWFEINRCT